MNNTNIPTLSISDAAAEIVKLCLLSISHNTPFKKLPTPFLWGAPGVGKSQGVRWIAETLNDLTGKTTVVSDVRLLLFSPIDIRGVPVADQQKQFAVWLMPKVFDMDKDDNVINILFLDELNAAPQSVQAAAYQLCLDRKIGEFPLPDNCIVIAAGNRTTDKSVAFKMPKALCNRLMHFEIEPSFSSWKKWALKNGINEKIIGYLAFDNSKLCIEPDNSDLAYPTPRSWEMASTVLEMFGGEVERCEALINGCIGVDTCVEFRNWCKVYKDLPSIDDILEGKCRIYPKTHDALYALMSSLVARIGRDIDLLTDSSINNVCFYAERFPKDFSVLFFKDLVSIPHVFTRLMESEPFTEWISKNKDVL